MIHFFPYHFFINDATSPAQPVWWLAPKPRPVASALNSRPELAQINTNRVINQINTRYYIHLM